MDVRENDAARAGKNAPYADKHGGNTAAAESRGIADYVVAIEGDEPMRIIRSAKEDLHDTVFLELDNGFTSTSRRFNSSTAPMPIHYAPNFIFRAPSKANPQSIPKAKK